MTTDQHVASPPPTPCDGCADTARTEFPGLPVSGPAGGAQMAEHLKAPPCGRSAKP